MAKRTTLQDVKRELAEVARVGQMFIDGDACRRLWAPGHEKFMAGDDMNYDNPVTVEVKKTLLKLERLSRVPCSTTLWRRRPDDPDSGEALLFGSFGTFEGAEKPGNRGYVPPRMTPQMRVAFAHGRSAWKIRRQKNGHRVHIDRGLFYPVADVTGQTTVQLFVPVKDSMGEIAALLEVFTLATAK
jgi:hypothetical protein